MRRLVEDQRSIQEMARRFTADRVVPFAAGWDQRSEFPRDTIVEAAGLGFGSIYISEEAGGIGLGRMEAALIMEDLRLEHSPGAQIGFAEIAVLPEVADRAAKDLSDRGWRTL